jgi:hypothetical protein
MKRSSAVGLNTVGLIGLALLAGCNGRPDAVEPPAGAGAPVVQGGVEYTGQTLVMESFPVQLDTRVTMRNRSSARATVELGSGCPVALLVYRDAARTQLVWDQSRGRMCTMQIQIVELAPGESQGRDTRASAYDILGDSLPDGRYYLSASVAVTSGGVTVPAGSADLGVPRQ